MNYQLSSILFKSGELQLERDGQCLNVDKQTATLLLLLIENANYPVSRERMVETVWQGKVVSDAAIASAIRRLRKAMSQLDAEHSYVKTIPKVGYQLVAEVSESLGLQEDKLQEKNYQRRQGKRSRLAYLITAFSLLVVVLIVAFWPSKKAPLDTVNTPPTFAQAWHLWVQKREELLPQSVEYLENILDQDPSFYEAHNMLAHIFAFKMSRHMGLSDDEIITRVQMHIQSAEALAPGNANSRIARAMLNIFYLRNLKEVRAYLKWTDEQENCSALCHFVASHASYILKKPEQGIIHAEKAYALQPDHVLYIWERAWAQFMAGNFEQALLRTQEAERFIARTSHIIRAMIAQAQGSNELSLTHWIRYYQNKDKLTPRQAKRLQGKFVGDSVAEITLELMSLIGDIPPDQIINLYLIAGEKQKALAAILNTKGRQEMTYILGAETSPIFTNAFNRQELLKIREHLWGE